jgi:hypothetical protein
MPKLSSYQAATNLIGATFPLLQAGVNKKITAALLGQQLPYTQPLTGAVERTLTSRLSDLVSIKDFGGIGDGIASNNTAYAAAGATALAIYNPPGTYKSTIYKGSGNYPSRMYGDGTAYGVSFDGVTPQKAGRYFSFINSPPTSFGDNGSILTAFNGDCSRVAFPIEHWVTGTTTMGQPTTGFHESFEFSPIAAYITNFSGWNNSTSSNTGRTAVSAIQIKADNYGQGGCGGIAVSAFVASTRAGSTDVLANPAGYIMHGGLVAGADGVYLDLLEMQADDQGYDVAAAGTIINLSRTNVTGAKNAFWFGHRVQSNGSGAIDTAFSAFGKMRFGVDLANATLDANLAAFTLKANQRIYGNAVAGNLFPSSVGDDWFGYTTNINGWAIAVDNSSRLQITAGLITIPSPNNLRIGGNVGFYDTAPVAKQTLTGAKGGNAALTSVIAAGVAMGLWTDTTT